MVHILVEAVNVLHRRDRYLKRLKAYLKGDKTVKVRMMNNKEVLVSKLSPCTQSLKELLKSKSGEPRFVSCHKICEC